MATSRRAPLLRVELRPSRQLALALASMHAAVLVTLLLVLQPTYPRAAGLAAVAAHAIVVVRRHVLLASPRSIVAFRFTGEDECELDRKDGTSFSARLDDATYVARWLIVLRLRRERRWRHVSVVVLADGVHGQTFRRLRSRLRWSRVGARTAKPGHASL
jgi:hypothetical protein